MLFCLLLALLETIALSAQEFVLMIPLYNERIEARIKEYKECLEKNLANDAISQAHILYDVSKDKPDNNFLYNYLKELQAASPKPIVITTMNRRQTFQDFFDLANSAYPNQAIIVANADIFFDETLSLLQAYELHGKFLALTRWEPYPNEGAIWKHLACEGPLRSDSQDVWIFHTPIAITNAYFQLGTIACDPYIALVAEESGLQVSNPCLTIRCFHRHESRVRHYNSRAGYDPKRCKILLLTTL